MKTNSKVLKEEELSEINKQEGDMGKRKNKTDWATILLWIIAGLTFILLVKLLLS